MKKQRGFTLMEVMLVVAIVGIVSNIAIPSFNGLIASSRIDAVSNDLAMTIQRVRSDAVTMSSNGLACPSANTTSCADSNNWATGWIAGVDKDGDGVLDADEITVVQNTVNTSLSIEGPQAVRFRSLGVTENNNDERQFVVSAANYEGTKYVCLRGIGTARVSKEVCT